ncbi:MAG: hypothetical protein LBL94_02415 [Prevotellaceae bacterium]|jgi:hypothetical protein|nr:hypothetical protein [Prevotellaceae bacterium]
MLYYYACALFTLISAAVSCGFSAETCLKSKSQKGVAFTNAKYAMSRSFSLFLAAVGLFIFISDAYLAALSVIMIGIQLFDGIIGIKISTFKAAGPILTAIGNVIVLTLFLMK